MNHGQVNIRMMTRSNFKILMQNLPVTSPQLELGTPKTLLQFHSFVSEYGLLHYNYSLRAFTLTASVPMAEIMAGKRGRSFPSTYTGCPR